jgi:membrane dipeptidase
MKHLLTIAILFVAGCAATVKNAEPPAPLPAPSATAGAPDAASKPSAAQLLRRARSLAKRILIVDGHVDLPYRLYSGRKSGQVTEDVRKRTEKGDFDHPRAVEGGLDAPFMSIYIPAKHQTTGGAKALADYLIDMVESLVTGAPDKFALAHTPAQIEKNFADGKISLPMGIENGAAIEGKLENLTHFFDRGVRYITLTHSKDNAICDSSYDERHSHGGLTAFGRDVVAEMNRLGIMIDVSHISDQAFEQVMTLSRAPVIASHSSCRHFTPDWERNMADAMIKRLAKNGGVIMINYGSSFLDDKARRERSKMWKALEKYMKEHDIEHGDPRLKAFKQKFVKDHPMPFATVEQVADHIDHVVKLTSIDHVGLGSDFDGVGDSLPTGLKDASQLPHLIAVLLARGYNEADIAKIGSGNVLRVWRAVEKYAASAAPPPH